MPNVLITTKCNKKCTYCFAKEKVDIGVQNKEIDEKEISFENLNIIINFFKKSKINRFALIGGEPTLHSKFDQIINILFSQGFNTHIFSNGTWKNEYNNLFKTIDPKRLTFLVNINPPEETDKEEWKIINNNLLNLSNRPGVTLGTNIYSPNFNYQYIIDLSLKYCFKKIRWSLTNPIVGKEGNAYVSTQDAYKYTERVIQFSDACAKNNIELSCDCSIPLCMFNEQQLGRLMLNRTTNIIKKRCIGPVDIGLDLSIWKCFAFSQLNNLKLTNFDNMGQILTFYDFAFKKYSSNLLPMEKCYECNFHKRELCFGGCIANSVIKHGLDINEGALN
jgi:radical SAM protein with 4Fe4S-binding SPASM domain